MRRKVFAIAAAVLCAAIITAMVVILLDRSPDFGMAGGVFEFPVMQEVELEGDTHRVGATTLFFDSTNQCYARADLHSADGKTYTFGSDMYVRGEHTVGDTEHRYGYIEKLADGEWVFYDELHKEIIWLSGGGIHLLFVPNEPINFTFDLQLYEPGTYRATYYFREFLPSEHADEVRSPSHDILASTSEELYSVSHTYTVPEASGKRFDLFSASCMKWMRDGDVVWYNLRLGVRANRDTVPMAAEVVKLEKRDESGYAELELSEALKDSEDGGWMHMSTYEDALLLGDRETPTAACYDIELWLDEPEAEYRLTVVFTEHADGTGEEHTLTLRFRPWLYDEV